MTFGKKYDAEGRYIRQFLPVLARLPAKYIYEPWTAPLSVQEACGCVIGRDYPFPIVDHTATSKVNMARILRISAPAATVVVGNPGVADVTIQDPQTLILTGKSYGQTNMIALDSKGNPIADTLIEVIQQQADVVTVYNAGERTSLACAPKCQPMVMLGDNSSYTSSVASSMSAVAGIAQ